MGRNRIKVQVRAKFVMVSLMALFTADVAAQTITIDFGTTTTSLPYAEDGFSVASLSGGGIIDGGDGDAELVGGTNSVPIRWQIARGDGEPFTLNSLDVENFFRPWRIEAAGAQTVDVTGTGTISFSGVPGWQGISSFQIVHDPGQANGTARIDNIVITVPEPTAAAVGMALFLLTLCARRNPLRS